MSKKIEKNKNVFKNGFFIKLFGIPSICFILLEILTKNVPLEDGSIITWSELLEDSIIVIVFWFVISLVIALIVNKFKKFKAGIDGVEEVLYIPKNSEEIENSLKKGTCESKVDLCEYKKMVKYFPECVWDVFVIKGLFLSLGLAGVLAFILNKLIYAIIFLIILQFCLFIFYRLKFEKITEEIFNIKKKRGEINTNFKTEFYENYFVYKKEKLSVTIDYSEVDRYFESDTNFYLECSNKNMIVIIQKDKCDLKLVSFIKEKFSNFKNNNIGLIKTIMVILFSFTIYSFLGAVCCFLLMNQHEFIFNENAWVFWCWLPIPIISIILGFRYKNKGVKCIKNIVAGFIIGFLLLIYGSFSLVPSFLEDYSKIDEYKDYVDALLPNNGKLVIIKWDKLFDDDKFDYTIVNAYYENEDVNDLLSSIENSENWILSTKIKSELKILLPLQFKAKDSVYYSIYNKSTDKYNSIPDESGEYEIYAMFYDEMIKQLSIYKFNFVYNK